MFWRALPANINIKTCMSETQNDPSIERKIKVHARHRRLLRPSTEATACIGGHQGQQFTTSRCGGGRPRTSSNRVATSSTRVATSSTRIATCSTRVATASTRASSLATSSTRASSLEMRSVTRTSRSPSRPLSAACGSNPGGAAAAAAGAAGVVVAAI